MENYKYDPNSRSALAGRYTMGGVIENSLVRIGQRDDILKKISSGTPILIRGYFRMGKTSMLKALEKYTPNPSAFIMFWSSYSKEDLKGELDYKVSKVLNKKISLDNKLPLENLDKILAEEGKNIILFFDEANPDQKIVQYIAETKNLSNITIVMALVGGREFKNEGLDPSQKPDIFSGYEEFFLQPLNFSEVKNVVQEPLRDQIRFDDSAIEAIVELTGGRPFEIQILCSEFIRDTDLKSYTNTDVKKFWNEKGIFEKYLDTVKREYEGVYSLLAPEEKEILENLANEDIPFNKLDVNKIQSLINTSFVVKDDKSQVFRINGELFKKFLLAKKAQ